jgi:hypothetical protein
MSGLSYIVERHDLDGRVIATWKMPAESVSMALDTNGILDHYELERIAFGDCDGSRSCNVAIHVHGCFGDLAGLNCDDPDDHA